MRPLRRTSKVVMVLFFCVFARMRMFLALKRHKSKSVKPLRIARCSLASSKSTSKYSDSELMLT